MLIKEALNFLKGKNFINLATSGENLRPNVAPKFLLKIEKNCIYLIDYVRNTTLKNIKSNPQISISSINLETLKGYQINGKAKIVKKDRGGIYKELLKEYEKKQIDLSAKRLINALHDQKKSSNYEAEFPKKVAIIKVKVTEAVSIGLQGSLERENF